RSNFRCPITSTACASGAQCGLRKRRSPPTSISTCWRADSKSPAETFKISPWLRPFSHPRRAAARSRCGTCCGLRGSHTTKCGRRLQVLTSASNRQVTSAGPSCSLLDRFAGYVTRLLTDYERRKSVEYRQVNTLVKKYKKKACV